MGFNPATFSNSTICLMIDINGLVRPATCTMSIDLSSITGARYNIFTGAANSKSFTNPPMYPIYPMYCGLAPSYEYQVIYSPASATPNLISLSSLTSKTIVFAQSSNPNDAATYSIIVNARFAGQTNWLTLITTAITTITYSDPC
jgi:hypothetical protein